MRYARNATRLYNSPLMLTEAKAGVIETVFRMHAEGRQNELPAPDESARPEIDAQASGATFSRADGGYLLSDGGVAVLQVFGTLVQRGDGLDAMSGLMGYNRIGRQLSAALEDDAVDGILLEIDSPGGEVNGCFDLAQKIRAAGSVKPVWAIANEMACSAAYALGSAAQKMYAPATAMVGNVGVIMLHVDQSKRDATQGYKFTPIFSGAKKNDFSSHEPLSDRAYAEAKAECDRIYDIFVAAVAEGRGIKPHAVRATEAGVLNPTDAVDIGFLDGVQTFSETLTAFTAAIAPKQQTQPLHQVYGSAAANAQPSKELHMHKDQTAPAAAQQPDAATVAAAAPAAPAAQAPAAAAAPAAVPTATDERARIKGITKCAEAEGRSKLAEHLALETEMSVEAARGILAASPKEAAPAAATNALDARMTALGNAQVTPDANTGNVEDNPREAGAKAAAQYSTRRPLQVAK